MTQHKGTQNAGQVSWLPALSLRRVAVSVHPRETLKEHKDWGMLSRSRIFKILAMSVSLFKSKFFGFTKNQTSIQHPLSKTNMIIPLILENFCVSMREGNSPVLWGGHDPKEVWPSLKSMMPLEKFFCFDDPIGQNRICSFVSYLLWLSIILNKLSFI